MPGVEVLFHQPHPYLYEFIVWGFLLAEGTEEDSITFSVDTLIDSRDPGWKSIFFDNHEDTISVIKFSKIFYHNWGIENYNSKIKIINSKIYSPPEGDYHFLGWNSSETIILGTYFGGTNTSDGVYLEDNAQVLIKKSTFNNISEGINMWGSSSAIIDSNNFTNLYQGINIFNSSPDCEIKIRWNVFENISSNAIASTYHAKFYVYNNVINRIGSVGIGDVYREGSNDIRNNIISDIGLYSIAILEYQTLDTIKRNCFDDSANFRIVGLSNIGIISTVNENGDSCDTFFNLFMDPYFADTDSYFLSDSSPCIDAGDPTLPWDPDGTPHDIGAHYYDQRDWVNPVRRVPPRKPALYPGYPNPFNTRVTVEYELKNPLQYVVLDVLDIRGKVVSTLVSAYKPRGWHRATWDGNAPDGEPLPSGVYLLRLREYNRKHVVKAVLMR